MEVSTSESPQAVKIPAQMTNAIRRVPFMLSSFVGRVRTRRCLDSMPSDPAEILNLENPFGTHQTS